MSGFVQSLGLPLVDASARPFDAKQLAPSDVVALYFSAHWCPPCRQFTPMLKKFVETLQGGGDHSLKVIFVSQDHSEMEMWKYMHEAHGNWLAVAYAGNAREDLARRFSLQGIPALVVLNQVGQPAVPMQSAVQQVMGASGSSTQVLSTYFSWRSSAGAAPASPGGGRPATSERCDELPAGRRVMVRGLVGAPEHNGTFGVIAGFDATKRRYTVELDGEESKSLALKAANLLQLAAARVPLPGGGGGDAEELVDVEVRDFDEVTGALTLRRKDGPEDSDAIVAKIGDEGGPVLAAGTRVVVQGLQAESAKQWNEHLGNVVEHDASANRYVVEVAPGTRLKIRPESVRLCPLC